MSKWAIEIKDFLGGLSPLYDGETYPSYGNKNMAGSMRDISLFSPNYMCQGYSDTALTGGGLSGSVTTAIRTITPETDYLGNSFAGGDASLYKIDDSDVVTSDASWPHVVNKATVTGEYITDVITYQQAVYYVYNHSGTTADIGRYNYATFDDDWGSTVPTGAGTLFSLDDDNTTKHPLCVGGNDVLYIGNAAASTVGSYDGTELIRSALDLPTLTNVTSLQWYNEKLYIFANTPRNVSGTNYRYRSSIYIWDGTTNSWETEIRVNGRVGGSHVMGGILFFFYQIYGNGLSDNASKFRLAYVNGSQIVDVTSFDSSSPPPGHNEITDKDGYLVWIGFPSTSGRIFAYGSGHPDLPARLFQFATPTYSNVNAIATPKGKIYVPSNNGSDFRLGLISTAYSTSASYKTLNFDVSGETGLSRLNSVVFNFELLESGARVDWSMVSNSGRTIYSDTISYAKLGAVTQCVYELNGLLAENFRIELSYANGSTSKTVKIKNIKVYGNSNQ